MGLFTWDFPGRCWSTSAGRCGVCLVEVPSWPGALWLQQSCFELRIIHSAFPQALAAQLSALLSSGALLCPAGWGHGEFTPGTKWAYPVSPPLPHGLIQIPVEWKGDPPFISLVFQSEPGRRRNSPELVCPGIHTTELRMFVLTVSHFSDAFFLDIIFYISHNYSNYNCHLISSILPMTSFNLF